MAETANELLKEAKTLKATYPEAVTLLVSSQDKRVMPTGFDVEKVTGYRQVLAFLHRVAAVETVLLELTAFLIMIENCAPNQVDSRRNFIVFQTDFPLPLRLSTSFYLCFLGFLRYKSAHNNTGGMILSNPVLLDHLLWDNDALLLELFKDLWHELPTILKKNPALYDRMTPELWTRLCEEQVSYVEIALRDPSIYQTFNSEQLVQLLSKRSFELDEILYGKELSKIPEKGIPLSQLRLENIRATRALLECLELKDLCHLRQKKFILEKRAPLAELAHRVICEKLETLTREDSEKSLADQDSDTIEVLQVYFKKYHHDEGSARAQEILQTEVKRRQKVSKEPDTGTDYSSLFFSPVFTPKRTVIPPHAHQHQKENTKSHQHPTIRSSDLKYRIIILLRHALSHMQEGRTDDVVLYLNRLVDIYPHELIHWVLIPLLYYNAYPESDGLAKKEHIDCLDSLNATECDQLLDALLRLPAVQEVMSKDEAVDPGETTEFLMTTLERGVPLDLKRDRHLCHMILEKASKLMPQNEEDAKHIEQKIKQPIQQRLARIDPENDLDRQVVDVIFYFNTWRLEHASNRAVRFFKSKKTNTQRQQQLALLDSIRHIDKDEAKLGALVTISDNIKKEWNLFDSELKKQVDNIIDTYLISQTRETHVPAFVLPPRTAVSHSRRSPTPPKKKTTRCQYTTQQKTQWQTAYRDHQQQKEDAFRLISETVCV